LHPDIGGAVTTFVGDDCCHTLRNEVGSEVSLGIFTIPGLVPGHIVVGMSVDVDETGSDDPSGDVDDSPRTARFTTREHGHDSVTSYGYVGGEGRVPSAIEHHATMEEDIV